MFPLPKRICRRSNVHLSRRNVSDWCKFTLLEVAQALDERQVTSKHLTDACIKQIEATRKLNMFVYQDFERARILAGESDMRREKQEQIGPLDGIPVGVKDVFCMEGIPTTASSKILEGFVSPYESTATKKLLAHGAVPLGKLNMDEFAMGSGTIYSKFGSTFNPWSLDLSSNAITAGGSSGGSAAAVASGCCFAALGSDTGGSVRQPAAYCGVVGLKPAYGRVSRHGMISYASSLDTPGVFAKSTTDSAVVLRAIAGPDQFDSTCLQEVTPQHWCELNSVMTQDLSGITVGIPQEFFVEELPNEIADLWDNGITWLREAGARVISVSLPSTSLAIPSYYILACAEASSNLSRYDGVRYGHRANDNRQSVKDGDQSDALHDLYSRTRSEGFGIEAKRRILSGTFVLSAGAVHDYYERAVIIREKIREEFDQLSLAKVDLLLTPTTPSGPFKLHQESLVEDPVSMYLNDVMTIPANMARVPSISVPVALTRDVVPLPLGLQLMGTSNVEQKLLQAAHVLETSACFRYQVPSRVYEAR